jgi:hypothetical protein
MPYCPQCGREQRCGCTECHSCGVPLVDRQQNSALPHPPRAASPVRRAAHPDNWDRAVRVTGLVMGGLSVALLFTCVLLSLPFGSAPYELRVLLPPLWAAIPVLFVTGCALLGAGFLMASRLSRQRESFSSRLARREKARKVAPDATGGRPSGVLRASAGTGPVPVKSYGAEGEGGATD